MNVEELKHKLKELFGEQIIFNKEFVKQASSLKNQENNLLEWCIQIKNQEITHTYSNFY